jgi:WD40 repeat protein
VLGGVNQQQDIGRAGFNKESFLTIWDVQTGRKSPDRKLLHVQNKSFRWPGGDTLSPKRDLALTRGEEAVELRDLATGGRLNTFPAHDWDCRSWTFSADDKFFAVGNEKGSILLFAVSGRATPARPLVTLVGHVAAVTSVHFAADGSRLVSGSDDTTIVVWDTAQWTGKANDNRND